MKVLLTGATGFVGRHTVAALLADGHEVTVLAREPSRLAAFPWVCEVSVVEFDIHRDASTDLLARTSGIDALVHLAWPGLPNYRDHFHFEQNLVADYRFLKSLVEAGLRHLLVTGTCFEYGMKSGQLSEDMPSDPENPYALAKDTLRKFLTALKSRHSFVLQWVRLFYLHGAGQNPKSLLAQLDTAIDAGEQHFAMSGGEQLRDYLPITVAAAHISSLLKHPHCEGLINCCSGQPISVRSLVEQRITERRADIRPKFSVYPYPDYEPMAFWGDNRKLASSYITGAGE